jgi:hypothetical protein
MANSTGWRAGRLFGNLGWNAAFGSELATLANNNVVASSLSFANGSAGVTLDQLIDLSFVGTIASSAVGTAAGISLWLAMLAGDGTTYGDARFTTTPGTLAPTWPAFAFLPITNGTITALSSTLPGFMIPPGSFKLIAQNQVGFAFTAAQIYIRSYDQDLNAT